MHPTENKVGIIGYGRFGKVLAEILKSDCSIKIYDKKFPGMDTLDEVLTASTLFIAVPIRHFEKTIIDIAPKLQTGTTVIDVCSVKLHPVSVMKKHLPSTIDIIATHPLFGPDSVGKKQSLKIVIHNVRDTQHRYLFWKKFFSEKQFTIIEMTPDEHDRYAAQSQGITHFIGRCLQTIDAKPTPIDTLGFEKLLEVMKQTCHDSTELFEDLLRYNPYSQQTIDALLRAASSINTK